MASKPQKPADDEPDYEAMDHAPPAGDQGQAEGQPLPDEGILQNVLLTCADFLPDRDRTWPTRNIAPQPQGFKVVIGSVAGIVHGSERRTVDYKGKALMSIWLHGQFTGTVRGTGEILQGISLIPPQAFAAKIERALQEQGEGARIPIDIDIGLEATGRTIPTRWFSIDYSESRERDEALALAAKHKARLAMPPKLIGKISGN